MAKKRGKTSTGAWRRRRPAALVGVDRLEWVEAGSLDDNPLNWRVHPEGQQTALRTMIDDPDVGWAGALLYNETTGRLIDGHLRKDAVEPGTIVPVLIGRWSEDAEKRILATLDPLAAMAEIDATALQSLLDDVGLSAIPGLSELSDMLDEELAAAREQQPAPHPADDDAPVSGDDHAGFGVVVPCADRETQSRVLSELEQAGYEHCRPLSGD